MKLPIEGKFAEETKDKNENKFKWESWTGTWKR